ncbi:E3 ubiquitin-protein ligase RBX1 [Fukomys damarensis]|uniref:E3 ubiquitin-protein ligase RBX1 n=1 Tax=Fukomys damarensis TaxID=885580 RepID=A0A091CTH6_FUKDA|nr:E3 ubiquitin-protein ligase RBX1 [Fukomys damarensis]
MFCPDVPSAKAPQHSSVVSRPPVLSTAFSAEGVIKNTVNAGVSEKGSTDRGAGKKRLEVKRWNVGALQAWGLVLDNCASCRNRIMELCVDSQADQAPAGLKSTEAWGVGAEPFPRCVSHWLKTQQACAPDHREWAHHERGH